MMIIASIAKFLRYGAFVAPSATPACTDSLQWNSVLFGPFAKRQSLAQRRDSNSAISISNLSLPRRPSQVTWLVMSVVVLSVERMLWTWPPTDNRQERLEAWKTKLNSASAITIERLVVGVKTAILCIDVCSVFRRVFSAVCNVRINQKASTRNGVATCQIITANHAGIAAFAGAVPLRPSLSSLSGIALNRKFSELQSV
jgi:hypothetical protein